MKYSYLKINIKVIKNIMEFVKYFLLKPENFIKSDNIIGLYRKNNIENLSFVGVWFPINCNFKYTICDIARNIYNRKIIDNNIEELKRLVFASNKNTNDVTNYIINKFNNSKSILYIITDRKFGKIDEIKDIIYSINNKLYKLGKTIKLYYIKSIKDLKKIRNLNDIKDLKYIILGENKIFIEFPGNRKKENYSITLKDLTTVLIGKRYIENLLLQIYKINIKEYSFCDECENAAKYIYLCDKCKSKRNLGEFKIIEDFLYAI